MQARRVANFVPTTLAVCCLFALALPQPVAAQQKTQSSQAISYQIEPGTLDSALNKFAIQSKLQVVYSPEIVAGKSSSGLSGQYSPQRALELLLRGKGVSWDAVSQTLYVLRQEREPAQKVPSGSGSSGSGAAENKQRDLKDKSISSLPEILVTGSRSLNVDIERTEDDIQPYVVFSRDDIDLSTASNLEEFLSTRLPMNQTRGTFSRNLPEGGGGNRSTFNLRGLGTNQTLILINGRRAPGVSTLLTGDLGQPDINGIPLSSVERVEVLPTTASGIYGGGATGGVINIVLRKDYVGNDVRITYDNTFDTDSARRRLDFSTGVVLGNGSTSIMLSGSMSDANDLLVRDRDYAIRGRQLMQRNDPAQFAYWGLIGSQTNIFGSGDLVLRNGTSLGSNIASIPSGYAGGDGGIGLLPGAGQTDLSIPNTVAGGRQSLSALPKTRNFGLTVRHKLNEMIDGYVDYGTYRNEGVSRWSGFGYSMTVSADSPINPFTEDVSISFPTYGRQFEKDNRSVSEASRLNAGLTFKLPGAWSASLDVTRNTSVNTTSLVPSGYDSYAVYNAVQDGTLNPFRDLQLYPLDLSPYLTETLDAYGPGDASLKEVAVRVGGAIGRLPAGEVRVTAVLSGRREEAGDAVNVGITRYAGDSAPTRSYKYLPSRYQDVKSFYAESTIPIVSSHQEIPWIYGLELQASFRRDQYKSVSVPAAIDLYLDTPTSPIPPYSYSTSAVGSNDYTFGFRYQPTADLTLRASVGTGFLPPSLAQIATSQYQGNLYLSDPKRAGIPGLSQQIIVTFGGSQDVKPEYSTSFSAGLIYAPELLPGLRLSADYTRIRKVDEIIALSAQQVLDNEDSLPGRIVRGPNLAGDPPGYAGPVSAVDMTLLNSAQSLAEAWDFQVEYDRAVGEWGSVRFYSVATLQSTLSSRVLASSPTVDRVGFSDGTLRWRANVGAVWTKGSWTSTLNTQWYDDYLIYSSTDTEWVRDELTRGQGSRRVPSQSYTDVSSRYTFSEGRVKGLWLSLGIRNVFGASPPVLATYDSRGGYSTYGDPRGRTYVFTLQKSF